MTEQAIWAAALNATDLIMDAVAGFVPEPERAALWRWVFAEVQAGIVAAVGAVRERENLSPSSN